MSTSTIELSTLTMAALSAVSRGWAVFPCKRDKSPLTPHGFKDATTDRDQVRQWWEMWEDASIGIATGASGLVVLDVDPRSGGDESFAALIDKHPLPKTLTVKTGGGGWHYYFLAPDGVTIHSGAHTLGRGLDVKAEGGYVIGAGSFHNSGQRYVIVDPSPIAPLPDWITTLLRTSAAANRYPTSNDAHAKILDGARNATLASLAGSMRRRGMSQESIEIALLAENQQRCEPPLPMREVQQIAASIARYAPAEDLVSVRGTDTSLLPYHHTDAGNAERLFVKFGDKIHYLKDWKKWATWDPPRWDTDGGLTVIRMAKQTIRALYREAGQRIEYAVNVEDDATRKEEVKQATNALKFALQSESDSKLAAMVNLTKEKAVVSPDIFDSDPWLLNCSNGVVDLRTGTLRPHNQKDYLTKLIAIAYDPDASCYQWEDVLETIFASNQELISWLQKAVGYTLTGMIREQVFFLCHGVGSNGKSTFLHQLATLMGEYGTTTPFQTFLPQRNETIRNDLAALRGCRFVSAIESNVGGRLNEAVLKSVTGGDRITARFLHGEFFSFLPQFKVWLASNHRPVIKDTSHAMWRRVCLIPFTVVIPDDQQDHQLGDKLKAEASGILAWAVRGCLRWQAEGLKPFPEIVLAATADYREESDVVAEFLVEECVLQPEMSTPSSSLYSAFCQWLERRGDKKPPSITIFGSALTEKGYKMERSTLTGRKIRRGIGLKIRPEEEDPLNS